MSTRQIVDLLVCLTWSDLSYQAWGGLSGGANTKLAQISRTAKVGRHFCCGRHYDVSTTSTIDKLSGRQDEIRQIVGSTR
jgi:hypothetical protein